MTDKILFWVRTHRGQFALMIGVFIGLAGFAAYKQISTSTPVTSEAALKRYRGTETNLSEPPSVTGVAEAVPEPGSSIAASNSAGSQQAQSADQPSPTCDWSCPTTNTPPENGTYEYYQCGRSSEQCTGAESEPTGSETASGINRTFPRVGQRNIRSTSDRSWFNEHLYSEEHTEEFDLSSDAGGVYNHRYKVVAKFGPITGGTEIAMQPPIRFASWPMAVGLTWKGSWTDANREGDGDYDCKANAKQELRIGNQAAKTWFVDCHLILKGPEVKGDVFLKFWLNPEFRNTAQEYYEQNLQTPQGPYSAKWMVTLANLAPKK